MTPVKLIYSLGIIVWVIATIIAKYQSWEILHISKLKNALKVLITAGIAMLIAYFFGPSSLKFKTMYLWMVPFIAPIYYLIYVIFSRNHRQYIGELFQLSKWNGIALFGSVFMAVTFTCI